MLCVKQQHGRSDQDSSDQNVVSSDRRRFGSCCKSNSVEMTENGCVYSQGWLERFEMALGTKVRDWNAERVADWDLGKS